MYPTPKVTRKYMILYVTVHWTVDVYAQDLYSTAYLNEAM